MGRLGVLAERGHVLTLCELNMPTAVGAAAREIPRPAGKSAGLRDDAC